MKTIKIFLSPAIVIISMLLLISGCAESNGAAKSKIKSGQTINTDYFKGLDFWRKLAGETTGQAWLVYGGDARQSRSDVTVLPWHEINSEQIVI